MNIPIIIALVTGERLSIYTIGTLKICSKLGFCDMLTIQQQYSF